MNAYACSECGFKLWLPVAELTISSLGLYDDARFPGRCLLVYRKHVEHLTELSADEACALLEDAREAAAAITRTVGAARINYAVLGNREPHLHVHLIPRRSEEPEPTRPPWEHPQGPRPLEADRSGRLLQGLKAALAG